MQYVVIGTSPFADTSVVCGPYRVQANVANAVTELEHRGYVTEVCPTIQPHEAGYVTNDEGAEE